jgi:hypothetical protein
MLPTEGKATNGKSHPLVVFPSVGQFFGLKPPVKALSGGAKGRFSFKLRTRFSFCARLDEESFFTLILIYYL